MAASGGECPRGRCASGPSRQRLSCRQLGTSCVITPHRYDFLLLVLPFSLEQLKKHVKGTHPFVRQNLAANLLASLQNPPGWGFGCRKVRRIMSCADGPRRGPKVQPRPRANLCAAIGPRVKAATPDVSTSWHVQKDLLQPF